MSTNCFSYSEVSECTLDSQSALRIGEQTSEYALLFRVLSGSCTITSLYDGESCELSTNYFLPESPTNTSLSLDFLNTTQEDISLSDYERHVFENQRTNRAFYKNLLSELSSAIVHELRGINTATFVHLYRAYEHLSYAFPMIYASKTNNYLGTFENLRKWLNSSSDGNVGELKFHKAFLNTLLDGQPLLSSTIDIDITFPPEHREVVFDSLCKKTLQWNDPNDYQGTTTRPDKISINFIDFHSFIISLRNRFFHYANGNSHNLSVEDTVSTEKLFSMVNKPIIAYIATIFHEIVIFQMSFARH